MRWLDGLRRLAVRLVFPLYVIGICGLAGISSDLGHVPAYVYRLLGKVPPDYWLGRPLEIPFLMVSRSIFVLSGSLLLGFYLYARLYISMDLSRGGYFVKVDKDSEIMNVKVKEKG